MNEEIDLETIEKDRLNIDPFEEGKINYDQFYRWYFSGRKSYSPRKLGLLKLQGQFAKIKNEISLEATQSLQSKIEINEQHLTVGFNAKDTS